MLSNIINVVASFFPESMYDLVLASCYLWFAFTMAGIIVSVVLVVRNVKGLFSGG